MTGDPDFPLYGRDAAIDLVREFLEYRPTPVVIFTGPPGCGKSTLLKELDGRAKGHIPHALVNCAKFGGRARELLALLAFELNRGSGRYGTVPFPRLITGLMALRVKLGDIPPTGDRDAARIRMRTALENRTQVAKNLQDTVQDVLNAGVRAVGAQPDWLTAALDLIAKVGPPLVLGWLVRNRPGRRMVLGKGQDWYGTQDPDAGHDAIDALIDLNRKGAGSVPDGQPADERAVEAARREAADLLWDAFLADLDDAFAGRPAQDWGYGPLVLLNRADDGPGELFLDELVKARTRRKRAGLRPDPLLVVAASRGPLVEDVAPDVVPVSLGAGRAGTSGVVAGVAGVAGAADPVRHGRPPEEQRWYPVLLNNLSATDVAGLARSLGLRWETGAAQDAPVFRYTGGHAGTSRTLLAVMAAGGQADLAAVLDGPAAGAGGSGGSGASRRSDGRRCADQLLAQLITGVPERVTENLVTCSAARDKEAALSLSQVDGLLSGEEANEELLNPAFWGEDQVLHPVLRRLLLRRLAGRYARGKASWASVHELLSQACASDGDEAGALYHALARGKVQEVTARLAAARATMGAQEWLDMIESVTAAPNSLSAAQHTRAYVEKLTGGTAWSSELEAATGQLVAAMWLDADPLSAPARDELHILARDALRRIARVPGGRDITALHDYARRRFGDDAKWRSQEVTAVAAPTRGDAFDPPRSAAGIARTRRRKLGAAALAVVVAAGVGTIAYHAASAPNGCGQTVAPFRLVVDAGECVGVTDGTTGYYFNATDPVAVSLQQLIGKVNSQAEQSGDYLTIALVDTLSTTDSLEEDVSPARIDDMLRGAYLALENADSPSGPLPVRIRLVLANVGSAEQGWQQVADQLKPLAVTNGPGRLIAIAGMGVSVTQTAQLASQLGNGGAGIPMFGAVTTGDTLDTTADPDLYRVVPSVRQEIEAMIPYLRRPGGPLAKAGGKQPQIAVVEDANTSDLYKQSMHGDFDAFFPGLPADVTHPYSYVPIPKGVPPSGQFAGIAADLCQTSPPPVVLYEGRESVLGLFIEQLNGDSACHGQPITIITGSDANALPAGLTHDTEGGANVTVYYADIEQRQASGPFASEYRNLAEKITGPVKPLPPDRENDPWMFATYDAVTAAWTDISKTFNPGGSGTPVLTPGQIDSSDAVNTANSFVDNSEDGLVGATGIPLWFTTQHDLAQPEIPIVEITGGNPPAVKAVIGTAAP